MNGLKIFALAATVSLSACANNLANFRPTMGADPAEIGYEAQALINEMRLAFDESDTSCNVVAPSVQNVEKEGYRRLQKAFGCVHFRSASDPAFAPQRYYQAGVALSDIYCDDYFQRIANHRQKRQFGRSATNDVGTAASAGLGLASAGSILTGGIGAAFGLADNLFRNYDAAFVVEPNLGKMLKLVKQSQANFLAANGASAVTDYFQALRLVNEYAQKCSYTGMGALLDRAIDAGSATASQDTSASTEAEPKPAKTKAAADTGVQR
jgi:hypothetical protein